MTLPEELAHALAAVIGPLQPDVLVRLTDKGTAHVHWVAPGQPWILRVPRRADINLEQQAAAFTRTAASGHTPRLQARLPPGPGLTWGALLLDRVYGRVPTLPQDLPALIAALACLHNLAVPEPLDRPPLPVLADSLASNLAWIRADFGVLEQAATSTAARRMVDELASGLAGLADALAALPPAPLVLSCGDAHPGNFLIDPAGKAWLIDIEWAFYGDPVLDIADLVDGLNTRLDVEVNGPLSAADQEQAFAQWLAFRPAAEGQTARQRWPLAQMIVRVRSLIWLARWRLENGSNSPGMAPAMQAHLLALAAEHLG